MALTTSSLAVQPDVLVGNQRPRILWIPPAVSNAGLEVVELASSVGLHLDDWQSFTLTAALGEDEDGSWAAFEVGLVVPRQNGKGSIIEARELGGLFLLGEELLIHTAHEFKTAREGFRRLMFWLDNVDWLRKRVKKVNRAHGEEGVELLTGQRILFLARTGGSGRGFSGDCLFYDEAMKLPETTVEASMPVTLARKNPQIWYTGSAGDEESVVLGGIRDRGIAGGDQSLAYLEWSVDEAEYGRAERAGDVGRVAADPASWAQSNPGLGIRIPVKRVAKVQGSMGASGFAKEHLGVGRWPKPRKDIDAFPPGTWKACADPGSQIVGPVVFTVAVSLDRAYAAIGVAGRRADGLRHVEIVKHGMGTGWVVQRLLGLRDAHETNAIVVDGGSPAGALIGDMEEAGLAVELMTGREAAQAYGAFYDAVVPAPGVDGDETPAASTVRYLPHPALEDAVRQASTRTLGEGKAWDGKNLADISSLVAVTNALHGHVKYGTSTTEPWGFYG